MSAEKTTTASKVIPITAMLRKSLEKVDVPRNNELAKAFRKFVCDEFDRRFEQLENVMPLAISTIVDPRFMTIHFKSITAVARARGLIEDMVKKDIREEVRVAQDRVAANTFAQQHQETSVVSVTASQGAGLWGDHDSLVEAAFVANTTDDPAGKARTELRAFLGRPPAPRCSNPLEVWESIKLEYPHVYKIARQFLPILATSVPSERMFSDAGRVSSDDGNRLSAEHLKQKVFLMKISDNIWFYKP